VSEQLCDRLTHHAIESSVTEGRIIRLHRMHKMQTIVTDVRVVSPSVCLSHGSTRLHCAKTAQRIKMLFDVNILWGP